MEERLPELSPEVTFSGRISNIGFSDEDVELSKQFISRYDKIFNRLKVTIITGEKDVEMDIVMDFLTPIGEFAIIYIII